LTSEKPRGFFARMRLSLGFVRLLAVGGVLYALPSVAAPATRETDQLLAELDADTAHRVALAGPLEKARSALARAHSMDLAGDAAHATLLRAAAREWLDYGKDAVRAVDAEAKADERERAQDELATKIVRGRALVEETVARRARAEALLEEVQRAAPAPVTSPKVKLKGGSELPEGTKPAPSVPSVPSVPSAPSVPARPAAATTAPAGSASARPVAPSAAPPVPLVPAPRSNPSPLPSGTSTSPKVPAP
jgi:hypothetical protein